MFYKPLTRENVTHIIDLMVTDLNRRLEDKQLTVELTPAAKDHIIEAAYDPIYGARPLRRAIAAQVEDPAADLLLEGALCSGGTLRVVADGDCVQVRPA